MSRLIVKNLPNGVSNPSGCQQPVPAAFRLSPLENVTVCVCVVCRWRRRGSGPCSLPSAPWRTALWSSPRTASSESSALWVLKPRTTLTEPWNTSTRASWTRPEWRYGSSHGFTQVLYKVFVSMCENMVVIYRRWRCVRRLETQLRRKPGANTPRAPARTNPPLLQTLTAKRYLQHTHTRTDRAFKLVYFTWVFQCINSAYSGFFFIRTVLWSSATLSPLKNAAHVFFISVLRKRNRKRKPTARLEMWVHLYDVCET